MDRIPDFILGHRKLILIAVVLLMVASAIAMPMVQINYNLSDYLADDTPSTRALKVLEEAFSDGIPNVNVYIPDVSIPEALELKAKFLGIDGVSGAVWLDDAADVMVPLETLDTKTVEGFYKDGGALIMLTIDKYETVRIVDEIKQIAGEKAVLSGEGVDFAYIQSVTMGEVSMIMVYVVPLVLIILLLVTTSWFEPLLFIITIGVAILLNEGTNIFIGQISYVTQACSAILQLAVSMDYAVFLLHSFENFKLQTGGDVRKAMCLAMKESSTAIAASMATTVFGFLALMLMKFKIGMDMGLVLAKGVLFSYFTVMVLLPIVATYTDKLMEKTRHRSLMPSFKAFGRFVTRICIPLAAVIAIVIVPCYIAQRDNEFLYGSSGMNGADSQNSKDRAKIQEVFGAQQQMVLMVPEGNIVSEASLTDELAAMPRVTSVTSYANAVGAEIPDEFLSESQLSQLRTGGYSRFILYVDTPDEGELAFSVVADIRAAAQRYYPDSYHLVGLTVVNSDLRDTIVGDNLTVTLAAVAAIGLVLLLTFRSLPMALILIATIEGAIWINLSLPYFLGDTMNFIGYQIISSVQLGATVDYGILFSKHYLDNRVTLSRADSVRQTMMETCASILAPASILFIAGTGLGIVSTNGVISQLGTILGRGALISCFMVLFFLPALLMVFDRLIELSSRKYCFAGGRQKSGSALPAASSARVENGAKPGGAEEW